jgi:DNA topoisomerase-1
MIIESPGKIAKLTSILGSGWKVAASVGHVRDLPTKDIGVAAPDFKPDYELTERGRTVVSKLKMLVKQADSVWLATDPDREGESISWHLQQCLNLKSPKRITFGEITESAVNAALAAPRAIDFDLASAQEARRVLDRLVGYMVSPALSRVSGQRLSAGRVQSPAVRLVVERERSIRAFKVTNHFGASLTFHDAKTNADWTAQWLTKPHFTSDDAPYFMDRAFATAVANVRNVVVQSFSESESKRSPPAPFTTSTMQQAASVALQLDPKAAMEAAQKLYEAGHITYHRTDNPNISTEALPEIRSVAKAVGLDMAPNHRKFKAPEGAQAGHPAVTPTHWDVEAAGDTTEQKALYKLIRIRALASQLADARYAVRTVKLESSQSVEGKKVEFEAVGKTLIYAGWLKLLAGDQTDEDQGADNKEPNNPVPFCRQFESLTAASGKLLEKKTTPPLRFTQATLIKKLESEGIGRPATYAAIMDNIMSRAYVKTEKKVLVPTTTGELIVDSLVGKFKFADLAFTRNVEASLDKIATGSATYKSIVAAVHSQLLEELGAQPAITAIAPKSENRSTSTSSSAQYPCPACQKPLRLINGKNGKFWGCIGYPTCSNTLPDNKGKPGAKQPLKR